MENDWTTIGQWLDIDCTMIEQWLDNGWTV